MHDPFQQSKVMSCSDWGYYSKSQTIQRKQSSSVNSGVVRKSCHQFTVCTFSMNLVTTPAFPPIFQGAPSVATLTVLDQSIPKHSNAPTGAVKKKQLLSVSSTNSINSLHTVKVSKPPRISTGSWETSFMSVLSSIATERTINALFNGSIGSPNL